MNYLEAIDYLSIVSKLRQRMEGVRLYGRPIDQENPDHLIISAAWVGAHLMSDEYAELAIAVEKAEWQKE